jgi:CheY-like chemotaxis protein
LLAEDNAIKREVTLGLLNWVGLIAGVAVDGAQAVQMAKTQAFDLILMDPQMPNMDSLAATRTLRAGADWASKPIVAMTANAFDEDRLPCGRTVQTPTRCCLSFWPIRTSLTPVRAWS